MRGEVETPSADPSHGQGAKLVALHRQYNIAGHEGLDPVLAVAVRMRVLGRKQIAVGSSMMVNIAEAALRLPA